MIGLLALPFRFLRWTFTNGWKGIIVLAAVFIFLVVGIVITRHSINEANNPRPAAVSVQDQTIPTTKAAPYLVTTPSRRYFAVKAVQNKAGVVTMTDYYQVVNKKWTLTKGVLVLDASFGKVTLDRR